MARATRNFYLLLFVAIFIIISIILYSSIENPSGLRKSEHELLAEAQLSHLRDKMTSLEETLRRNGEEMDRLRKALGESEKARKELMRTQIEKENEIYDEKKAAADQLKRVEEAKAGGEGEGDGEERRAEEKAQVAEPKGEPEVGGNKAQVVRRFLSRTTPSPALVCGLRANMSVPHTDIQMFDMYDLLAFDNPDGGVWKQGWEVTYDGEAVKSEPQLEIIVVPHSHCDPGWILTFEEYFEQQTKHILDGMANHLPVQTNMSFIYAEVSFFEKWWQQASEEARGKVKSLLQSGRLEIVTGAWVMTDEANAHFHSIVVEMMEGHEWIANHLPKEAIPRSHWSIDPFGLSPVLPALLAAANVTRAAIQRVHYSVKKELARQRNLEFVWRQMYDSSHSTDVLTHMFPFYSYDVPHTCGPDPKICCQFDFRRLPAGGGPGCPWNVPPQMVNDDNVATRSALLYDQYRKKAQLYKTNALLVPLGDDFRYDSDFEWKIQYDNYEKLFAYMNGQKEWNVKARFGTLSDYFSVLERHLAEQKKDLSVLSGDFFTYADRDDHYWSGYFTSRPFYKQMDRVLQHYLRSAEIAYTLARIEGSRGSGEGTVDESFSRLISSRRSLSLFQHHDGVTGTAKDHVMKDYGLKMLEALNACEEVIAYAVEALLHKKGSAPGQLQMDESRDKEDSLPEKRVAEVGSSLILFNTLSTHRMDVACVRVADARARVKRAAGDSRPRQQLNPVFKLTDAGLSISIDEYELCFEADVGPLSLQTYHVVSESTADGEKAKVTGSGKMESPDFAPGLQSGPVKLANNKLDAELDQKTGMLKAVTPVNGVRTETRMHFVKYGARGHNRMRSGGGDDLSGAYLFLPDGDAKEVPNDADVHYAVVKGELTSRVWARGPKEFDLLTIYALDAGAPFIEITSEVDVQARRQNVEVAMKIVSSVESGDSIYTDLNAMQMIRRRRQLSRLPLQAHFYPMPSTAFIESSSQRLTLLGAQPRGVASLKPGELEVMLERRLLQDDGRGLQQGVLDNHRTVSHFRLMVESLAGDASGAKERMGFLSQAAYSASLGLHYPWVKMLSEDTDLAPSFTGLRTPLPCDTHIVTLRTMAAPTAYTEDKQPTLPTNTAALVVYRPLLDCRSTVEAAEGCREAQSQPTFSSLLGPHIKSASPASLTMLHQSDQTVDRLTIEPQEIKTFKIQF